jgi:hypothetical protein
MKKLLPLMAFMSEISFGMLPDVGDSCVYTEALPKWEKCSAFVDCPFRQKLDE